MKFIDKIIFEQCPDLEMPYNHNGMPTVPGYTIDCTNGHTYLIFGPDMDSVKRMSAYSRLFRMVKKRMSDHDYDPIRMCFHPAWSSEKDEWGDYKVFHAPASEMGKIYLIK